MLKEERFQGIDKIKTVGSTYMAVVGLIPGNIIFETAFGPMILCKFIFILHVLEYKINPVDQNSIRRHMTALVEYVKAMRMSLQEINSHSYNNFMLRVGK